MTYRQWLCLAALALASAGCGTTQVLSGHAYEDVWFATQEAVLERDPHAMIDREKGRQVSENREERWYWDAVRWLSLGSFGTTGDYLEVGLKKVGNNAVEVTVKSGFEMVAAYLPLRFPRGAREAEVLARIKSGLERRLAKGELTSERQIEERYEVPRQLQGNWDEQGMRESLHQKRLAAAGKPDPARTAKEREPQHPAPRQTEGGEDLHTRPLVTPPGMVLVPAGEFVMGAATGEPDEKPERVVYCDSFYIDRYEVTNADFREFVTWMRQHKDHSRCHPDEPPGKDHVPATWKNKQYRQFTGDQQPVVGVDWYDAYAYARWRGKRLPTEAEWEKAARGTASRRFPWGEEFDVRLANTQETDRKVTAIVGAHPGGRSPFGAEDMAGNVWEWCGDWFQADYYRRGPRENPQGPAVGNDRLIRGGSWAHPARMSRATYRNFGRPIVWSYYIGFRCAQPVGR